MTCLLDNYYFMQGTSDYLVEKENQISEIFLEDFEPNVLNVSGHYQCHLCVVMSILVPGPRVFFE